MDDHALELRPAEERDIPALAALWTQAFPGGRSGEERMRELREGMPYGTLADCRILELEGRTAAALRAYRMRVHFRGRTYAVLGLAGVAVAPDFRRRGLGRRICIDALREGRRRGHALSLLYPFRVSFYEGLGYALAGELHQYRFRPADLPLYPGWERVRAGGPSDVPEVRSLYGRVASRSNGLLDRPQGVWRGLTPPGSHLYLYRPDDAPCSGYAVVRSAGPRRRPALRVRELLWEHEEAYRALLGWLSAQRDQHALVVYDALPSEAFHRHLPHPRYEGGGHPRGLWFESARLLRGPMLRVLDVGALQEGGGQDEVGVSDEDVPENRGRWRGGRRVDADPGPPAGRVSVAEAGLAFLEGSLPGQAAPPEGWEPSSGIRDFRLLDEF